MLPAFKVCAQDIIIDLNPHHQQTGKSDFNKIIVNDHRPDVSKIGVSKNGKIVRFNNRASFAIEKYIEKTVSGYPMDERIVMMDIKGLGISKKVIHDCMSDYVSLSVDLYDKKNDSTYIKLASINRLRQVGYSFEVTLQDMVDNLIGAIGTGFALENDSNTVIIRENEEAKDKKWAAYPILQRSNCPQRYYPSFDKFRDDSATTYKFDIQLQMDSTYKAIFQITSEKSIDSILQKTWAITDSTGMLYIQYSKNIFLPLTKRNNSFYFKIPHSLPDMASLELVKNKFKMLESRIEDHIPVDLNSSGKINLLMLPAALVAEAAIDLTKQFIDTAIVNARVKKIYNKSYLSDEFRNCYIDMDTGEIVY